MPKEGHPAPAFAAKDQHGNVRTLREFHGTWLLLYFYPKDDTPGCTAEACGFRDASAEFAARNITILGVSKDSVSSHDAFAKKYKLSFPLLADDGSMCDAYGVMKEKNLYGKNVLGIQRTSFLINPEGVIAKIYPSVDPQTHAAEILGDQADLLP